jgi:hypothetical protein
MEPTSSQHSHTQCLNYPHAFNYLSEDNIPQSNKRRQSIDIVEAWMVGYEETAFAALQRYGNMSGQVFDLHSDGKAFELF